jgi:hypothetical protein
MPRKDDNSESEGEGKEEDEREQLLSSSIFPLPTIEEKIAQAEGLFSQLVLRKK